MRIKVSSYLYTNFVVGCLKKKMENRRFYNFSGVTLCIFPTLRVFSCIETLVEQVMWLKRLVTAAFGSLEQFCMLKG